MTGNGNLVKLAWKKIREITSSLALVYAIWDHCGAGQPAWRGTGWPGGRPVGLPVIEQR